MTRAQKTALIGWYATVFLLGMAVLAGCTQKHPHICGATMTCME